MIEGVKITKLKQIFDERGKVMHMLRNDSEIFQKFGEIYFFYDHIFHLCLNFQNFLHAL